MSTKAEGLTVSPAIAKPISTDGWIDAKEKKPKCNKKFSESEDVLCWTCTNTFFVGWYNKKLDQWFVSHFLAETVALSYDNIPAYWMPLPSPPDCR